MGDIGHEVVEKVDDIIRVVIPKVVKAAAELHESYSVPLVRAAKEFKAADEKLAAEAKELAAKPAAKELAKKELATELTPEELTKKRIGVMERLKVRYPGMEDLFDGTIFNLKNNHRFTYNEVLVDVMERDGAGKWVPTGKRTRVDSWTPDESVVSRKHTQLASVQPATARTYIKEAVDKYSPDEPRLVIADTPGNSRQFGDLSEDFVGRPLRGPLVLEVPVQTQEIPEAILKYAHESRVRIRDAAGNPYVWKGATRK